MVWVNFSQRNSARKSIVLRAISVAQGLAEVAAELTDRMGDARNAVGGGADEGEDSFLGVLAQKAQARPARCGFACCRIGFGNAAHDLSHVNVKLEVIADEVIAFRLRVGP